MRRNSLYTRSLPVPDGFTRTVLPQLLDEIDQSQEIIDPKSTPPGGHRDKGVLRLCVGPASGQAYQLAVLGMEVHPILTPGPSEIDEPELPPVQGGETDASPEKAVAGQRHHLQLTALSKGRVERAIRYIRESFFAAREFTDLGDLNAQATVWCDQVATDRLCPEDRSRRVREMFVEERGRLLALPDNPFPCQEREQIELRRTPYVRFDLNDYLVPHTYVRRSVEVHATLECVRIVDGTKVIATHPRSWGKGEQIEMAEHVADLIAFKRAARHHRGLDRLHHACSHAAAFFAALAERHGNLGAATTGL